MKPREITDCHDCGAKPGEHHDPGCDTERCMLCGHQRISCPCVYEVNELDYHSLEETHPDLYENGPTDEMYVKFDAEVEKVGGPEIWTGLWPGTEQCREFDLWCKGSRPGNMPPWVTCDKDDPDASEDFNRLNPFHGFEWSKEKRKWVKR